jgi:DnaJ family protein A protein 5
MFIRKRDPRYIKETIDEAKLQASLLAASQSQAARAKASFQENLKDFQTQDWMEVEQVMEEGEESEESEVEEEFECVACRKIYKNERYFPRNQLLADSCADNLRLISKVKNISKRLKHYAKK